MASCREKYEEWLGWGRRLHNTASDYLTTDELKEFDTSSRRMQECIVGLIYDIEYFKQQRRNEQ